MNNDESKQTKNINHNQNETMESENNVLDNDESNQNQASSCNNDEFQDQYTPPTLKDPPKRKPGRQKGQIISKKRSKLGRTLSGAKSKKVKGRPQSPSERRTNQVDPPPAPQPSAKVTARSLKR